MRCRPDVQRESERHGGRPALIVTIASEGDGCRPPAGASSARPRDRDQAIARVETMTSRRIGCTAPLANIWHRVVTLSPSSLLPGAPRRRRGWREPGQEKAVPIKNNAGAREQRRRGGALTLLRTERVAAGFGPLPTVIVLLGQDSTFGRTRHGTGPLLLKCSPKADRAQCSCWRLQRRGSVFSWQCSG